MEVRREIGGRILVARVAHHQPVETDHAALARIGHHLDLLLIARLETDGRRGGDVEMTAESGVAVELQIAVDLEEMEMRTDLNRTVARVAHDEFRCFATGVVFDGVAHQNHAADCDGLRGREARLIRIETLGLTLLPGRRGICRIHNSFT